jgi:hypothetical protein
LYVRFDLENTAMRYEVRLRGFSIGTFEEPEEALERVRQALAENADDAPEIIDMETGKAFAPGATNEDPDDLEKTPAL